MFPQVVENHKLREVGYKSPFDSVLTEQYLCQKLTKSVNVRLKQRCVHITS